ncbi:hypothetical protein BHE74_00023304 [Ensete ventricosum]|uniref:Uncharacterized protein n=1 Tax=Ensete ventricosum TaxID=4639 RepID=A0A445MBZ8_ENSVE|nr:hypothetical protein BHE74_00023304 [Ensete ventricosum]RZR71782.1 hypothetical protein BHM03_00007269 [Ensete ventricosum]
MATKKLKLEDTTLESKEKDTPQSVAHTIHTLARYTNLQKMKIEGFLEQQLVIVFVDTGSTHNFMSSKVAAHLILQKEDCSRDKLLLRCYIPPNSLWLLMQHFQISSDFHDFSQDQTIILKVSLDDDLRSTAQNYEKIKPL